MSAYANGPRVETCPDGTFNITDSAVVGHVCPAVFGGWVGHSVGVDEADGLGFDTADEAISERIGDPQ